MTWQEKENYIQRYSDLNIGYLVYDKRLNYNGTNFDSKFISSDRLIFYNQKIGLYDHIFPYAKIVYENEDFIIAELPI